jgi:hypothetical protein
VNDDERGLLQDIDDWLERLAPHEPVSQYRHNNGEDNADAHLKRQLMAHQVVLAITDGRLDLGPWEQVFYAEFDGRRRKRVLLRRSASSSTLRPVARTKRQRKLEMRRRRDFQRELERRVAAGEQVVAILGPKTKTTALAGSFGEPVDSDYAKRLEEGRALLREPPRKLTHFSLDRGTCVR